MHVCRKLLCVIELTVTKRVSFRQSQACSDAVACGLVAMGIPSGSLRFHVLGSLVTSSLPVRQCLCGPLACLVVHREPTVCPSGRLSFRGFCKDLLVRSWPFLRFCCLAMS